MRPLEWIRSFFKKKENEESEVVRVMLVTDVWAYGFKSEFHVNSAYFYTKFKVLKSGSFKDMHIYFDKMDKLKKLTHKEWILIVKTKNTENT